MTLPIALILPAMVLAPQQPMPPAAGQIAGGQNVAEQIACAPASLPALPQMGLRVSGGLSRGRMMFAPGESLLVNAGTRQGLRNGQMYFVRRHLADPFTPASIDFTPVGIHTAGWVTIVDARDDTSVAQVTHACDGILDDDYLEPYTEPVVPDPLPGGAPDFEHPARIVMADETLQTAAPGMLMLINRGSDHGVRPGQGLTIFRATLAGAGPTVEVGRGTILSVRPQTSLMRVDDSRDAVYVGDLAALHRINP
jgi:hypothetical protein